MAASIKLLEELSASDDGIEEKPHPYQRADRDEQHDYDKALERLAQGRESRERAAASSVD